MKINESAQIKSNSESPDERNALLENLIEEYEDIKDKYECLYDRSIESIYIHDLKGRFLEVNKAGLDLTGYTKEEISKMSLPDILKENQIQQALDLIDEVISDESPSYPVEFKIKRKDGSWLDVEVFPSAVYKNGAPFAIMGVCRDITDRKNYEEAIQESEKNFRAIAENAGAGILVITGIEGRLSYINRMFSTLSGYNLQELRHKTITDLLTADCSNAITGRHKTILRGGVFKKTIEAGILRKDGSAVPVEMISARTYWKGEHAELVLIHDISARKAAAGHEDFSQDEDLYKLAIEAGGLRFWKWDSETEEIVTPRGSTDWKFKGLLESFMAIIHPDDRWMLEQLEKEARAGKNQFTFKARIYKDPTTYNWVQVDGRVYRDDSGNPKRVVGIAKNITDQVNAEMENARLLREKTNILDVMDDGLFACDIKGKIIEANPALMNMTGLNRDELISKYAPEIIERSVEHEDAELLRSLYPDVLSGVKQPSFEVTIIHKNGKKTPVHFSTSFFKDSEGKPGGIVCVIKDITYQKKTWDFLKFSCDELEYKLSDANTALKDKIEMLDEQIARKTRLEELVKQQRDLAIKLSASIDYDDLMTQTIDMAMGIPGIDCAGVYIINRETGYMEMKASKGCSEKFIKRVSRFAPGSPQIQMIEKGIPVYGLYSVLFPTSDKVRIREGLKAFSLIPAVHEGKVIAALAIASRTLDEIPLYAREFFDTVAAQTGAALFRMWTEDDLDKKQIELAESENKYRSLVESMNEIFFIINSQGAFSYLSPSVEKILGYSVDKMLSESPFTFVHPDDRKTLSDLIPDVISGKASKHEFRVLDIQGNIRWVNISIKTLYENGQFAGIQGIFSDITESKVLQQRLFVSERLAATGQLAASVAHEINSPLQAITITLSSMKKMAHDKPDLLEGIELLKGAFSSISNTVRNLLDLNRPGMIEKRSADINDILTKTASLVKSQLKQNRIRVLMELGKDLPFVKVSTQHIGQVFLNLINNAIDAIAGEARSNTDYNRDLEGGTIKITSLMEDDAVTVRIEDTGSGIKETDIDRIFNPFFSTKNGAGMGIGLAICKTIVEENGGIITAANSSEHKGAVFTIKLPQNKD
ncbi:MAG TPA: PAS domain S-box protein [Desulfomonilia bacterium]